MKRISVITVLIISIILTSSSVFAFQVTSSFGWRIHPVTGKTEFHTGIDIAGEFGSPIYAVFDGEVAWAASYKGYGLAVLIRHSGGRATLYGHCSSVYVVQGQRVTSGERIAAIGSTGISTGPHLHFEYWVNNRYVDPMVIWQKTR